MELGVEYQLVEKLKERNISLALAESLTAGMISSTICNVSGASQVFKEGVISYSNESKITRLGVDERAIKEESPVSSLVACQMAEGVRKNLKVDMGLASTGVAGPDDYDSDGNPRGLFYIAISYKGETYAIKYKTDGSRQCIREKATEEALKLALKRIEEDK